MSVYLLWSLRDGTGQQRDRKRRKTRARRREERKREGQRCTEAESRFRRRRGRLPKATKCRSRTCIIAGSSSTSEETAPRSWSGGRGRAEEGGARGSGGGLLLRWLAEGEAS